MPLSFKLITLRNPHQVQISLYHKPKREMELETHQLSINQFEIWILSSNPYEIPSGKLT